MAVNDITAQSEPVAFVTPSDVTRPRPMSWRAFCLLTAVHVAVFALAWVGGWSTPPAPGATVQAPAFAGVSNTAGRILKQNVGALVVLVAGSVCSAGMFGLFLHGVNGYMIGVLMRAVSREAPHVTPWLWAFVPAEVLAFACAGAAASAVALVGVAALRTGQSMAPQFRQARCVVGASAVGICGAAFLEALLIQHAWGL